MKICFLVFQFPVLSEAFILNQVVGLIKKGHEVHIHALDLNGLPQSLDKIHPAVEQYQLLDRTYYSPVPKNPWWRVLKGIGLFGANLHRGALRCLPLLNVAKYGQAAYSLKLFYRALPLLDAEPYDIIHCQFGSLTPLGLLFRDLGLLKGKFITSFRGVDISSYVRQHGDRVYKQLFAKGDFFLANCEFFRRRAIDLGCDPSKILVHRSGIDCRKFSFTPRRLPPDGLRIVTIGRLVEKKGLEYGIRAIAKVAQTTPNLQYKIIGDGPLREELQALIHTLNLTKVVKLLGWKQQQEIVEILSDAQILIAPSVTAADGDQDAPVNTLKEAMAMGMPVIGTLHGGIPELIADGVSGFLVPERNAQAIAEKLNYLIAHPQDWARMGAAGRARVEAQYDSQRLSEELVEIYQHLLNSPSYSSSLQPSVAFAPACPLP